MFPFSSVYIGLEDPILDFEGKAILFFVFRICCAACFLSIVLHPWPSACT